MCGRFVQKTPLGDIRVLFERPTRCRTRRRITTQRQPDIAVVRFDPQTGARSLDLLRWGFVPLWAKDPSFGPKCINARSETIATNRIFRDAFARRRCLVPADAFYEWQKSGGGKTTQPSPNSCRRRAGSSPLPGCGSAGKTRPTAASCAASRSSPRPPQPPLPTDP